MSGFDRLHPAIQHHVVNSLGWRSLRPLQEQAIGPVLDGEHALLIAPTAGGKTEAAVLPVLSRMLSEDWRGLSVIYLCPIKALLNNLAPRLGGYAELVGRRVALWHGDVGSSARARIVRDPPDILLTTPESLEVILTSSRTDHRALFSGLRCIVVDELHAFAGDDRGWHLLAVAERIAKVAGRDLQRIGLSATVGNPEFLLEWLAGSSSAPRRVVAVAPAASGSPSSAPGTDADVTLDYVGTLANAATVIARLHRGEKRLVFCDSRARVEQLAHALRAHGANTFVSHSSLSTSERQHAEAAFASERDSVIVATSTLELGIDVGDLDHVIQIDAPGTVASFLQRLGRTGRRAESQRNCLFLATNSPAFLQAAALLELWRAGFVEPITPPELPYHILSQQLMALALQERGVGRRTWRDSIGKLPIFVNMQEEAAAIVEHMLDAAILHEDAGVLGFGREGERSFGWRNFMELMTVFTGDPLITVRHGREDLGHVHPLTFAGPRDRQPVLLLAGRGWLVKTVDWQRRVAYVEATEMRGRSQWLGAPRALHFDLCRAMRRVLAGDEPAVKLTERATEQLATTREEFAWVGEEGTALVREVGGDLRWWTFAGLRANAALGQALGSVADDENRANNLNIKLADSVSRSTLVDQLEQIAATLVDSSPRVDEETVKGLKFADCLPRGLAVQELRARLSDARAVVACTAEPVCEVVVAPTKLGA